MRPIGNKIILRFNLEQKETYQYGTLKLYIPNRALHSENLRETGCTVAEVVHGGKTSLKPGDIAVFVHTVLDNQALFIEKKDGFVTLTMPADGSETIYGKLGSKGEVIPMFGHLVCKRIDEGPVSNIIITPDAYKKVEPNKGIVIAADPECGIKEGQTVYYHKYSDYELVFSLSTGEERRSIMVKRNDIVAWEA